MLISLSAIVCETGPVASADDWWAMAAAIAEGAVLANMAWMRRRSLDELDMGRLRLRYTPRPALHVGESLGQGIRLAPALVHDREGSCIDLSCFYTSLHRLRGRVDTRVEFRIDPIKQRGHALVVSPGFEFDPMIQLLSAEEKS
jgi:hypothetical protein